eukprot:7152162-Alexandrium_andersonii.AAC.1
MRNSVLGLAATGHIYRRSPSKTLFHPVAPAWLGDEWTGSGRMQKPWRWRERDERAYRLALDSRRILE